MRNAVQHEDLIAYAQDIALRWAVSDERKQELAGLITFLKYSVVWRVTLYSPRSVEALWDRLKNEFPHEVLISMTSEFVYRTGLAPDGDGSYRNFLPITMMIDSLTWLGRSNAVTDEERRMVATTNEYSKVLTANSWAIFVYLLSMSDLLANLTPLLPKPTPERGRR